MRAAESIAAVQLKMKEDAHENDKETLRNQLKIVHDRMVSSKKILRSELTKLQYVCSRKFHKRRRDEEYGAKVY